MPGLQRAQLGLRPGQPEDLGRARRRRVDHQRPEGLDDRGHHADYCFLLTRTDPDAPKHKGISYLLVPMRQPGVEVRGITQPDGTAEFCEVFFNDARCPKDNVVGGVNNGWKVANSTLGFERGQSATTGYRRFEEEYKQMVGRPRRTAPSTTRTSASASMQYYTKSRSCASTACARCRRR